MAPKTKDEIRQAALALNNPDQPFVIKTSGDQIIGEWNIVDAKWQGILSTSQVQKDYSITISLDEASHKYKYVEKSQSTEGTLGLGGLLGKKEFFSGKQFGTRSTGITIGLNMKNKDEPAKKIGTTSYNFSNDRIKKPLLDLLKTAGWSEDKAGFLSKLFGGR